MGSPLQEIWWRVLSARHANRPFPHRHAWHRSRQDLSPHAWFVALFQSGIWRIRFREGHRKFGRLDKYPTMEGMQMPDHERINIEDTHLNTESHVEQRGRRIRRLRSRCCDWTKRESLCGTETCSPCTELKFIEIHATVTSSLHALIACCKASVDMQHIRQRRAEASQTWCQQQASSTSPAD